MLTLDKFEEASEKVKEVTLETKLVYSDYWSQQTGNKVYLKPENMQFTGAYKVRGAYYKISTLSDEERAGADHGIGGKPRAGCGIRSKMLRLQGSHRHADHHTAHQGEPHQELRRRSRALRRCL